MAKAFSLASWNVEHFSNPDSRVDRVIDFLVDLGPPDVFALYEVEGKEVYDALVTKMPGYSFHITEGPQIQEILLGVRSNLTAFFTQKTEFKSGLWALRPGALVTLTIDSEEYPILFLHTKSGVEPLGLGLRDDMLTRALDFKKVLAAVAGKEPNYMFLGDLNTMGMQYKYMRERDIAADLEVLKASRFAEGRGMRLLAKDEPATWWNGGASLPPTSLDQVIAADHLSFRTFNGAEVTVLGWPKEQTTAARVSWIEDYSDHGCLYLEVEKA